MASLFSDLLVFFGIAEQPANFAEFVPWFMSVLCAIGFFLYVFGMIKSFVVMVSRSGGRW